METLKKRFIAHCLIGLLASLAVILLATITWMSPSNTSNYLRRGCFGYLGMGYEPVEWGNRGCGRSYDVTASDQQVTNLPNTLPNLADMVYYNIPEIYPVSLQNAIRDLPLYPNAKAQDFDPVTARMQSDWMANIPAITVQIAPVYTITAYTATDSPRQVRSFYKNALKKTGWQLVYSSPSDKNSSWRAANGSCSNSFIEDTDNSSDQGCRDVFLGRYRDSNEQKEESPYYFYLTTTLASKVQTVVKLQVGLGNGS